jgi:hypothetical protein
MHGNEPTSGGSSIPFGPSSVICLWAPTGLIVVYLTFTTWRTAVIAFIAGAFQDRLAAYLLRALQWLNLDMTAIYGQR